MSAQYVLRPHPTCVPAPIAGIEVLIERASPEVIRLSYRVIGVVAALNLLSSASCRRCDELWRHTCAELFVAAPGHARYVEFNFSPSSEWAAYQFDDYRQSMRAAQCAPPLIEIAQRIDELQIDVCCNLPEELAQSSLLICGIAMVVEDAQGQCSYWALHHSYERPDFHHRDSFIVEL